MEDDILPEMTEADILPGMARTVAAEVVRAVTLEELDPEARLLLWNCHALFGHGKRAEMRTGGMLR